MQSSKEDEIKIREEINKIDDRKTIDKINMLKFDLILCEDKQKWPILMRIIKKKERTQQEKIINESRNIIIDNTEIQRTIKEQLKDSKLDLEKNG